MERRSKTITRITVGSIGIAGLALTYIFQRADILGLLAQQQFSPEMHFSVNRFVRIFLNDIFMLQVLYSLFADAKVLKLALWVQAVDLFVLLPLYLAIKLSLEGDSEISSPYLSQFHRLIVNPTLMILLIPAVYYQKLTDRDRG